MLHKWSMERLQHRVEKGLYACESETRQQKTVKNWPYWYAVKEQQLCQAYQSAPQTWHRLWMVPAARKAHAAVYKNQKLGEEHEEQREGNMWKCIAWCCGPREGTPGSYICKAAWQASARHCLKEGNPCIYAARGVTDASTPVWVNCWPCEAKICTLVPALFISQPSKVDATPPKTAEVGKPSSTACM